MCVGTPTASPPPQRRAGALRSRAHASALRLPTTTLAPPRHEALGDRAGRCRVSRRSRSRRGRGRRTASRASPCPSREPNSRPVSQRRVEPRVGEIEREAGAVAAVEHELGARSEPRLVGREIAHRLRDHGEIGRLAAPRPASGRRRYRRSRDASPGCRASGTRCSRAHPACGSRARRPSSARAARTSTRCTRRSAPRPAPSRSTRRSRSRPRPTPGAAAGTCGCRGTVRAR